MLIGPDSKFNTTVSILLGTNILVHFMSECRETYWVRYLQKANLSSPLYLTFRSLSLREKQLARNGDKIALIKSAERSQVIIHPNTKVTIQCHLDQRTPISPHAILYKQLKAKQYQRTWI